MIRTGAALKTFPQLGQVGAVFEQRFLQSGQAKRLRLTDENSLKFKPHCLQKSASAKLIRLHLGHLRDFIDLILDRIKYHHNQYIKHVKNKSTIF